VVSRPSGAACRVRGDRTVVGPTPLTLAASPPGKYEVRVLESGFEHWERTIQHQAGRNDTVWMSLHPKTRSRAVLRSMGLPGWGQFYSGRPAAGWLYMTGAVVAFGGSIGAQVAYSDRIDEAQQAATLEEWERAAARVQDAREIRNTLQGVAAGLWFLSVVDAAVLFPRFQRGRLSAGLEVDPDPRAGRVRLAATIEF